MPRPGQEPERHLPAGWLAQDDVDAGANCLLAELRRLVANSSRTIESGEYADVVEAIHDAIRALAELERNWFFASVGVRSLDGEFETKYLSKGLIGGNFTSQNLFAWTSATGRVWREVKAAVEQGLPTPAELAYGRPGAEVRRPVGPMAEYHILPGGELAWFNYYWRDRKALRVGKLTPATHKTAGLKELVEHLDLEQDDQIRGPLDGAFVITGGPGVGKTSVALHRIPYLLQEQPEADALFFTQESMRVLVWHRHLVPFARECLRALGCGKVPVGRFADWASGLVANFVLVEDAASSPYRLTDTADPFAETKLRFADDAPSRFLTRRDAEAGRRKERRAEFTAALNGMIRSLEPMLDGTGLNSSRRELSQDIWQATTVKFNLSTALALRRRAAVLSGWSRGTGRPEPVRRRLREAATLLADTFAVCVALLDCDYASVLFDFYASEEFLHGQPALGDRANRQAFLARVATQRRSRELTADDAVALLWLLLAAEASGAPERSSGDARLPRYSHVVLDEAQMIPPAAVRLLVRLTRAPRHSLTIAGDLEQRLAAAGGVVSWAEAGVRAEAVRRLETNYRWSRHVYAFLDRFRQVAGLETQLRPPRRWFSGEGAAPVLVRCGGRTDEPSRLARAVRRLLAEFQLPCSGCVVVFPAALPAVEGDRLAAAVRQAFLGEGMKSEWASDESLVEAQEGVVRFATSDQVLGLEFPLVAVTAFDAFFAKGAVGDVASRVRAAWVVLTRAMLGLAVSFSGPVPVFDGAGDFSAYFRPD